MINEDQNKSNEIEARKKNKNQTYWSLKYNIDLLKHTK